MRRSALCLAAGVLAAALPAQAAEPPDLLWSRTFASADTEVRWIQQTSDGGFVAAGSVTPDPGGTPWDVDMYLLRLDKRGDVVWQDTYSFGESHAYALSVQQTGDGGYVLGGGADSGKVAVVKTDATGNVEWRFSGFPGATIYNVQQTADGGYITSGLWQKEDSLYLLKLDALGRVAWRKSYNEFYRDWWARIPAQQTTEGGYVAAAEVLLKTSWQGNQQWKYSYPDVWVMFSVQQTSDGGYIAAGVARAPWPMGGIKPVNMVLLKVSSAGVLLWKKVFTAGQESVGRCARQTFDGGYILGGYVTSGDSSRATVVRTNSQGDALWTKTFPAPTSVDCIQQTSDGGYILCEDSRHIWRLAPDGTGR